MDSMVSTVPSAWLAMENALARLARDFAILTILTLVSRRREPPLLVPDRGFGSRVCPRNRGPHRPPRPGFVLSRSDGADASVEPDGLVDEPVRRSDARRS